MTQQSQNALLFSMLYKLVDLYFFHSSIYRIVFAIKTSNHSNHAPPPASHSQILWPCKCHCIFCFTIITDRVETMRSHHACCPVRDRASSSESSNPPTPLVGRMDAMNFFNSATKEPCDLQFMRVISSC